MNRLLTLHHTKYILTPLTNGCFAKLAKVPVVCVFDTFFNYSSCSSISIIGTKRCFSSNAQSIFNKRSQSTNVSFKKLPLKYPKNREQEIKFLEDFQFADKFTKNSSLTHLVQAAKSRQHSFTDVFRRELCNMLSEWLSADERTWQHVPTILKVLHLHDYFNVPVDSPLNRMIGIWVKATDLNKMGPQQYCGFLSLLVYLPSLQLNEKHMTIVAYAAKKYIKASELTNYDLVTFIWCWTWMRDDNIKLSQLCPEVLQLWFDVTLHRIPQFTAKQCSQCFVALAKEGKIPPLEWQNEMTKKLLSFTSFDKQTCSNISTSITKVSGLITNDSDRQAILNKLFSAKDGSKPTNVSCNVSDLKLPTNREEEIKFREDFQFATKFTKSSSLTKLVQAAKSREHSFTDTFRRELCNMFSEWLSADERMWQHVPTILKVLHLHDYLNVPVDSHFNRTICKWIQMDEFHRMSHDEYFSFLSTLAYLPSLNFDNELLMVLASAAKKYIDIPKLSNYRLVTLIWCWTNMDENIKLSQLCPEVLHHWFDVTLPRIPLFTAKECSQCFVALGKEGEIPPLEWKEEMTKKLLGFTSLDVQTCSNISVSIAKCPDLIANDLDRKTVLKKLFNNFYDHVQKERHVEEQAFSNICYALGTLYKSDLIDFKPPRKFWNVAFNAKCVGKFKDKGVLQMLGSIADFDVKNVPSTFLKVLFSDFKATIPNVAGLILYVMSGADYKHKVPQLVIRNCFKVWNSDIANLPFEQLTFPRFSLDELYPIFKLKPIDIIPDFGNAFWSEIERRLDFNEVDRAKNIYYLIKPHLIFNDVPIPLLNRMIKLTEIEESAEGAANMLRLYGDLCHFENVEIPDGLLRHNFKMWFAGLHSLHFDGHLVDGLYALHCHNINPNSIIPNFWAEYWKKIEMKAFTQQDTTRLRNLVQSFAAEISEDLFKKYMNK